MRTAVLRPLRQNRQRTGVLDDGAYRTDRAGPPGVETTHWARGPASPCQLGLARDHLGADTAEEEGDWSVRRRRLAPATGEPDEGGRDPLDGWGGRRRIGGAGPQSA